jgi:hypothetical protein
MITELTVTLIKIETIVFYLKLLEPIVFYLKLLGTNKYNTVAKLISVRDVEVVWVIESFIHDAG